MIPHIKSSSPPSSAAAVWLVDNGSLRAQSTLSLRQQAALLAAASGVAVEPVSVLHSDKVPAEHLNSVAAEAFTEALRRRAAQGLRALRVVPYFFGPSAALTEYLPYQTGRICAQFPHLRVEMTPPLVDLEDPGDQALPLLAAQLLANIEAAAASARPGGEPPAAVLVDHGSPQPAVSAVRDAVGQQLRLALAGRVRAFAVASMEAREGAEYDHSRPLLAQVLEQEPFCRSEVIIAPLFLSPGRHAGQGGDLARIAAAAMERHPQLHTRFCPLLGGTAAVTEILLQRLRGPAVTLAAV